MRENHKRMICRLTSRTTPPVGVTIPRERYPGTIRRPRGRPPRRPRRWLPDPESGAGPEPDSDTSSSRAGAQSSTTPLEPVWFAPVYRLLLHFTHWAEDEGVVQRLRQAVRSLPSDRAREVVRQARMHGTSIVLTSSPDEVEHYLIRMQAQSLVGSMVEA